MDIHNDAQVLIDETTNALTPFLHGGRGHKLLNQVTPLTALEYWELGRLANDASEILPQHKEILWETVLEKRIGILKHLLATVSPKDIRSWSRDEEALGKWLNMGDIPRFVRCIEGSLAHRPRTFTTVRLVVLFAEECVIPYFRLTYRVLGYDRYPGDTTQLLESLARTRFPCDRAPQNEWIALLRKKIEARRRKRIATISE